MLSIVFAIEKNQDMNGIFIEIVMFDKTVNGNNAVKEEKRMFII